jgi:hypothetical protein
MVIAAILILAAALLLIPLALGLARCATVGDQRIEAGRAGNNNVLRLPVRSAFVPGVQP